jgi:16S rRNA (uracil1498-N3)-methyltransferase
MTRRRWIADEVNGDTAALVGDHAAHLTRVLRAQVGQVFDIAAGEDLRRGTITKILPQRVEFALDNAAASAARRVPGLTAPVTLALAIFKFDRMEWAMEKCTEIGVRRIIPVMAGRSDAHLVAAAGKRQERWQRLLLQAAEQSRQLTPPEITEPVELKELPEVATAGMASAETIKITGIVLAESLAQSDTSVGLREVLLAHSGASEVMLAVGPEGGWTPAEEAWFQDKGWLAASLGETILRAETAAIVASALAMDALR